jgi:hypothetical protein
VTIVTPCACPPAYCLSSHMRPEDYKEYQGGYYAKLDTAAGPLFFGIHPQKADAPKKCSASVSVVFRVDNFEGSLLGLKSKGLLPDSTEKDPNEGQ